MNSAVATSSPISPVATTSTHPDGGNLAPLVSVAGGPFIHEQPHQFGAQIRCAAAVAPLQLHKQENDK